MKRIFSAIHALFETWFHKRNIIIVSEHKVKHVPVGARTQFIILTSLLSCVCLASYSTGSYMAARSLVKERTQALRSVTSVRTQAGLPSLVQVAPLTNTASNNTAPTLSVPLLTPAVLDHGDLFARIAFLEQRVMDLTNTNDAIVQRVREKTAGRISNIESLIKESGLNVEDIKKQAQDSMPVKTKPVAHSVDGKGAEGGPFIPDDLSLMPDMPARSDEMLANLNTLEVLEYVVDILPKGRPVGDSELQSGFGHRIDPFNGRLAFHSGLDMAGPMGTPVHSTATGKVVFAGWKGAYGNCVDIDHGLGIVTRYGHMSEISVNEGDIVKTGDIIGLEGSTGRSTGPHVHYEVRYYDRPLNPVNFIDASRYVFEE